MIGWFPLFLQDEEGEWEFEDPKAGSTVDEDQVAGGHVEEFEY